ncbi:MAG: hypothetical protein LBG59_05495 [Candidatus Peribacteria bacterium]|jgi:flagellar basal body-associated protein FliL|nr:hypothetical protein [Candidatus Peribacteria bacterium]
MKKSLVKIIIFFIILTILLGLLQQHLLTSQDVSFQESKKQENITETKEVSLSKWLELYHQ